MFTTEEQNYFKTVFLIQKHGTAVLTQKVKQQLHKCCSTFTDLLKTSFHAILHLHNTSRCCECKSYPRKRQVINSSQFELLFVTIPTKTCSKSSKIEKCSCCFEENRTISEIDLDVSLLSVLLTNVFKLNESDKRLIEKLRDERNRFFHIHSASLSTNEFNKRFQTIQFTINGLAQSIDTSLYERMYRDMIDLESAPFTIEQSSEALTMAVKSLDTEDIAINKDADQIRDIRDIALELQRHLDNMSASQITELDDLKECLMHMMGRLQLTEESLQRDTASMSSRPFQKEIVQTSLKLDLHVSPENVFQSTQQLNDSVHILDTQHILVLSGIAGSGKTSLACEVMFRMREEYTPVILSQPGQLNHIDPSDKVVVLFEDIVGQSTYSASDATRWVRVFDNMYVYAKQGNTRFILSFRENVYEDFIQDADVCHHKLFSDEHLVNVCMKSQEKMELLEQYLEKYNVSIYFGNRETIPKEQSSKMLDRKTFQEICTAEPLTGFPQTCYLFFTNPTFLELGYEFFCRPDLSLVSKVDRFRKSNVKQSRLQYAVLVYMMLTDTTLDIVFADKNEKLKQIANDLEICSVTYGELLDCVEDEAMHSLLRRKDVLGTEFIFRHQTIQEAVFVSLSQSFPNMVIQESSIQLIKEFYRASSYVRRKGEVVVSLHRGYYSKLANRLVNEIIQTNNFNKYLNVHILHDRHFASAFVSRLIEVIQETNDHTLMPSVLQSASYRGCHVLLSELLQVCDIREDICDVDKINTTITMTYFREEIMSTAIRERHVEAVKTIVERCPNVLYRSKIGLLPIHFAIFNGYRPVFEYLWSQYDMETKCSPSFNDKSGRRCLHYCEMRGYIDSIREIRSQNENFVLAKDSRSRSALHWAVYGGQYQILPELIGYALQVTDRTDDGYSVLQIALISLDYDERYKVLPPILPEIYRAISADNSVLWNYDYYRTLEVLLALSAIDLKDLEVTIDSTHRYNIAHYACIDDKGNIISYLLNKRRDIFTKPNSTCYPMVWDIAAYLGRYTILRTLETSGLVRNSERMGLIQISQQGRKQARVIKFKDRRLLLNRHDRQNIWPDCCFPFVLFGQECDYDAIESLLQCDVTADAKHV